jgi:hypothetical protein
VERNRPTLRVIPNDNRAAVGGSAVVRQVVRERVESARRALSSLSQFQTVWRVTPRVGESQWKGDAKCVMARDHGARSPSTTSTSTTTKKRGRHEPRPRGPCRSRGGTTLRPGGHPAARPRLGRLPPIRRVRESPHPLARFPGPCRRSRVARDRRFCGLKACPFAEERLQAHHRRRNQNSSWPASRSPSGASVQRAACGRRGVRSTARSSREAGTPRRPRSH